MLRTTELHDPWFSRPKHPQGEAIAFYYRHRVADRCQPITSIRRDEKFGFNDPGPVGERQEFHRFAGHLIMGAPFDNQPEFRHGMRNVRAMPPHASKVGHRGGYTLRVNLVTKPTKY